MMKVTERQITGGDALRTVIVDDSALARLMLRDALSQVEGVQIVGNACEGEAALEVIDEVKPGLIILDVEMPGMNGLELLKQMNFRGLDAPVLMCSRLTSVGAEVTAEALLQGAYDVVCKPSGGSRQENVLRLRHDLIRKIAPLFHTADEPNACGPIPNLPRASLSGISIDAILIGASTGGPVALHTLLARLDPNIKLPIFVVQHIPVGFSEPLSRRLGQVAKLDVVEARDGAEVVPGTIYIAPGGHHTTIAQADGVARIQLVDGPPVNGCRPSVDVMVQSASRHYLNKCLAVILTGMGRDGADAAKELRAGGGIVFAQDPDSCIVSSMPRHTIGTAGADRVGDLTHLADSINSIAVRR